jgi:nicotinamide-nucleotide amidase
MMEAHVVERVDALFGRRPVFKQTYRTTGIGESAMTPLVSPIFEDFAGDFVVSSLPHLGGVDLVLTQRPDRDPDGLAARAGQFERRLRKVLGDKVYAIGNETLEEVVGGLLTKRGETVAVAESLTGGLIGKRLTDTPGSSRYFLADVVAYSNDAKEKWLGVAPKSLEAYGAVSEAVCREMALGVRSRTGATWSLATTGIAGPDGGTKDKPVGLTYFGVAWGGGDEVRHRVFPGGRDDVRDRVAFASLFLLYRRLVNS